MRDHGSVAPAFWNGSTGRKLRKNKDARILMTYYMTGPGAHALGLYYVPIPTILHETGLTEDEFKEASRWLASEGAAFYDADREWVWVPRMASFQLGETIKANDKRMPWIRRHLERFKGHTFYVQFILAYGVEYCLVDLMQKLDPHEVDACDADEQKTLPGAAESLRTRQEGDQDQGQGKEQDAPSRPPAHDPAATSPGPGRLRPDTAYNLITCIRAQVERLHPELGFWDPGRWAEADAVKFYDRIPAKDLPARVPVIEARIATFAAEPSESGWPVKDFLDRINELGMAKNRAPPGGVRVGQARAEGYVHPVGKQEL